MPANSPCVPPLVRPSIAFPRCANKACNIQRREFAMSDANKTTGLQLRSLIAKSGELELSLAKVELPEPGEDQVLVKVEATPINPSDLGLLLGPADMTAATATGSGDGIVVTAKVSPAALAMLGARLDKSMTVGNEGAGTVVKAGASPAAQALLG